MAKRTFSSLEDDKSIEDQLRDKEILIQKLQNQLEQKGGLSEEDQKLLRESEEWKKKYEAEKKELENFKKSIPTDYEEIKKELDKLKKENTVLSKQKSQVLIESVWKSGLPLEKKEEVLKTHILDFSHNLYTLFKNEVSNLDEASETVQMLKDLGETLKGRTHLFMGKAFSEVTKKSLYKEKYETIEIWAEEVFGISYDKMRNYRDAWDYFYSKILEKEEKNQKVVPVPEFDLSKIRIAIPVLKNENFSEKVKNEIITFIEVESSKIKREEFEKKYKDKLKEIEARENIKLKVKRDKKQKDSSKKKVELIDKVKIMLLKLNKESLLMVQEELERIIENAK